VTGGGRNIGRAIVLELAQGGYDVAIGVESDRASADRVADEVRALGRRAISVVGDISDPKAARRMVAEAADKLGTIGVLVNNAAIRPTASFIELTDETWHRVVGVNLHGPYYLCKAVVPGMIEARSGSIINLSGTAAYTGGVKDHPVAASKAGLQGLTKSLAVELGPFGIRVNSVVLASIDTVRKLPSAARPPRMDEIPLRRKGHPDDVAKVCAWLASAESAYVTGTSIHVNGGRMPTW
jgi:3-oxoacyl-[acyl-carrier protein] reductase